ncbi:FkbM family methyltransferase [Halopseudomonas pachastrellae]|uniref:FkbM family methyltransferase n=1 Tax=Halopseudomonas pachastrellae TaxID=254161 RepID=UPI003D7D149A
MMNYMSADLLRSSDLVDGCDYRISLPVEEGMEEVHFRFDSSASIAPEQGIVLRNRQSLEVLRSLGDYPGVTQLLSADVRAFSYDELKKRLGKDIYIFGAHQVGVLLARLFIERGGSIHAFLDNDVNKHGRMFDGIPVRAFDVSTLAAGSLIVLGSGRYSGAIQRELEAKGWDNIMTMQQFLAVLDVPYIAESSFRNYRSRLVEEAPAFISAFLCLGDERSREVFDGLVSMRLSLGNAHPLIRSDFMNEYLEPDFIAPEHLKHYVDAGAYDGDTLTRVETRFGPVESGYLFEPEQLAFLKCQRKFGSRAEVKVLCAAMTESRCELPAPRTNSCDVLGVLAAKARPAPLSYVPGHPLDEVALGAVTLIKLDIEGAEAGALRGARRVIERERPKLCVCAYHRSDDLWRLIDVVLSIRGDYRVGVRHYSDIIDDTTLYFY